MTELLEGETLRACIGRGPVSAESATRVARDVALGLVVAHGAGLVHRDLKPDNIFLTRTRRTTILDFGIAKLIENRGDADALATATGVLLGTASYLTPEQIRGGAVDARTDLFALGAMLFEMVTGTRAFAREHMTDTLHAILHDGPPHCRHRRHPDSRRSSAGCSRRTRATASSRLPISHGRSNRS